MNSARFGHCVKKMSLTTSNPAFLVFARSASLLALKIVALGLAVTSTRLWTNTYGTSDDRVWPWIMNLLTAGKWAKRKTVAGGKKDYDITITAETKQSNQIVDKVNACYANDAANVPSMLALSLVYLAVVNPSEAAAKRVFYTLVATRYLHTVAYLAQLQPFRGLGFVGGSLQMIEMAVAILKETA